MLALQPHHFLSYIIFFLTKNYQTVVLTELWEDLKYMIKKFFTQMIFKYPFTYKNISPSYVLKIFSL